MGKKIVHVEFPAQDVDRAEKFWEAVGGWSIEGMNMPGVDYRMYQEGDQGGAVYAGDGGPLLYYGGDDIDADIAKVRGAAATPKTSSRFPESAGLPGARTRRATASVCSRATSR